MKKRIAIFTTACLALVLFKSGCDTAERDTMTAPEKASPPIAAPELELPPGAPEGLAEGATHRVSDILGAPHSMSGKTVTIVGAVDEIYGPRAFTLVELDVLEKKNGLNDNAHHAGGVDNGLLVLIPKVGSFPNVDNQWKHSKARVTGVIHRMLVKNVEREIGWDLAPKLESSFKGKPVLIVRAVERLTR